MKLLFTALVLLVSASFAFSQTLWSRAKTTPENKTKVTIPIVFDPSTYSKQKSN